MEFFLFNDALNTFYLWLYGVRHMVKDHSDSERGNPLMPHGILFLISSKGYFIFYMHYPIDRIAHTMAFVTLLFPINSKGYFIFTITIITSICYTSHGALAGTRNTSVGPLWRIDPITHHTMSKRSYHGATSRSP